jgi:hypothetical protein
MRPAASAPSSEAPAAWSGRSIGNQLVSRSNRAGGDETRLIAGSARLAYFHGEQNRDLASVTADSRMSVVGVVALGLSAEAARKRTRVTDLPVAPARTALIVGAW